MRVSVDSNFDYNKIINYYVRLILLRFKDKPKDISYAEYMSYMSFDELYKIHWAIKQLNQLLSIQRIEKETDLSSEQKDKINQIKGTISSWVNSIARLGNKNIQVHVFSNNSSYTYDEDNRKIISEIEQIAMPLFSLVFSRVLLVYNLYNKIRKVSNGKYDNSFDEKIMEIISSVSEKIGDGSINPDDLLRLDNEMRKLIPEKYRLCLDNIDDYNKVMANDKSRDSTVTVPIFNSLNKKENDELLKFIIRIAYYKEFNRISYKGILKYRLYRTGSQDTDEAKEFENIITEANAIFEDQYPSVIGVELDDKMIQVAAKNIMDEIKKIGIDYLSDGIIIENDILGLFDKYADVVVRKEVAHAINDFTHAGKTRA